MAANDGQAEGPAPVDCGFPSPAAVTSSKAGDGDGQSDDGFHLSEEETYLDVVDEDALILAGAAEPAPSAVPVTDSALAKGAQGPAVGNPNVSTGVAKQELWAKPMRDFFQSYLDQKARKATWNLMSGCTGTWTEGMACKVHFRRSPESHIPVGNPCICFLMWQDWFPWVRVFDFFALHLFWCCLSTEKP